MSDRTPTSPIRAALPLPPPPPLPWYAHPWRRRVTIALSVAAAFLAGALAGRRLL